MNVSRRGFVAGAATLAAVPGVVMGQNAGRVFKFAVIGCGGRGTGAAKDFTQAAERLGAKAVMVGAADYFMDKAQKLAVAHGCDPKFAFDGPTAYQKIMATDADVVLLCSPPFFRPLHVEAAVAAKKHIFAEKPIATDPAGIRRFLKSVEAAKAANLYLLSGTCHRHNNRALRQIKPIRDGAIGAIRGGVVYRCHGGMWHRPKLPGQTNAAYLSNNWYNFTQMSGDHLTEQAIHEIDLANWFIGRLPRTAMGIGARHRRVTGNIYDCISVDYDYGEGLHIHALARQVTGCTDRLGTLLTGTEGEVAVLSKITRFDGKEVPYDEAAVKDRDGNMMMMEHYDFLKAITDGAYMNEGEQVAMATAAAMMGTLAAYTGRTVRLNDLLTNTESEFYNMNNPFLPEQFDVGDVELPKEGAGPVPGKDA